ncbi:hypothetical protein ES702_01052 [subsurface metagenome]
MSATKVQEMCRRLKPILGDRADTLWVAYLTEDYEGRKEIESMLQILYLRSLNQSVDTEKILLSPPPREVCFGEYPIGMVCYNEKEFYPLGIREEEWIQHLAIFGRSGAGKTNTVCVIILNLLKKKKPFLIFDWKRNYRDILEELKDSEKEDILVFTVGRNISPMVFNPLIPPEGTGATTWLKKFIEIVSHAYFLGEGVMYLLQKAIDSVYQKFGVYKGVPEKYPTMKDVHNWLKDYPAKGREAQWMSSTLRAMGTLCFGEMGRILNVGKQIDLSYLLKKNVILELDALTNSDKIFFIESLLLWIHHYRLAQGKRETFKHAIILEEAHHILLKQKQESKGGEAITDTILREIRELGESVILIDQHPSLISIPALGNTYCTIAMNLKHRSDVNIAADCMLLDGREKEYLGKLEVGYGIVKLQGRWFSPFLIKFPLIKIKKGIVTDEVIRRKMRSYSGYSEGWYRGDEKQDEIQDIPSRDKGIQEKEERYLVDILKNTLSGVVQRNIRLKISARRGNNLKESLVSKGLIETKEISTRSGRTVLTQLTKKGCDILRKLGYGTKNGIRRYGPIHEFWRDKVKRYYEKLGYEVTLEKKLDGERVDFVAEKDGEKIAIEIETGNSNAIENIKKCLDADFDLVISVPVNRQIETKIREGLKRQKLDKRKRLLVINSQKFE